MNVLFLVIGITLIGIGAIICVVQCSNRISALTAIVSDLHNYVIKLENEIHKNQPIDLVEKATTLKEF